MPPCGLFSLKARIYSKLQHGAHLYRGVYIVQIYMNQLSRPSRPCIYCSDISLTLSIRLAWGDWERGRPVSPFHLPRTVFSFYLGDKYSFYHSVFVFVQKILKKKKSILVIFCYTHISAQWVLTKQVGQGPPKTFF